MRDRSGKAVMNGLSTSDNKKTKSGVAYSFPFAWYFLNGAFTEKRNYGVFMIKALFLRMISPVARCDGGTHANLLLSLFSSHDLCWVALISLRV